MARLLINTIERNGLRDGDVVSVHNDDNPPGRNETPQNGFVSLIVSGSSKKFSQDEFVKNTKRANSKFLLDPLAVERGVPEFVEDKKRAQRIDYRAMGLEARLKSGEIVKVNRQQVILLDN